MNKQQLSKGNKITWSSFAAWVINTYGQSAVNAAKNWWKSSGSKSKNPTSGFSRYYAASAPKNFGLSTVSTQNRSPQGGAMIAPVSFGLVETGGYMRTLNTSSGLRIQGKELIGSKNTAIAFTNTNYTCTPTDTTAFPRLSTIAALFDKYKFHNLRFTAKAARPTTETGVSIFSFDYDATDAGATSEAAVMATSGSNMVSAYLTNYIELDTRLVNNDWYYTGTVATTDDTRWNYTAGFNFSVIGQVGAVLGWYLSVEYDVELIGSQS